MDNEIRLRSRFERYRVGNDANSTVQFGNFVATVTPQRLEQLKSNPFFGPDKDFWVDSSAAQAKAEGENAESAPPPTQIQAGKPAEPAEAEPKPATAKPTSKK